MKRVNEWDHYREWDYRMRTEYFTVMEAFPQKVDELLDALDRVRLLVQLIGKPHRFTLGVQYLSTSNIFVIRSGNDRAVSI